MISDPAEWWRILWSSQMSKQKLHCKMCQAPLTAALALDDEVREFKFGPQDDSLRIPVGQAWIIERSPVWQTRSLEKEIWFSPKSLTDEVVTDRSTFGCCGHTGRNNTRCKCGYIIGSRIDECAYQPRFEPNLKMTYWASADLPEIDHHNG